MPPRARSIWPARVGHGAGECTAFVAEEFAFEELLLQGAAMQRDKRRGAAGAVPVDDLRREGLAGAGGAGEEHGRIGRAGVGDLEEDALHRR